MSNFYMPLKMSFASFVDGIKKASERSATQGLNLSFTKPESQQQK